MVRQLFLLRTWFWDYIYKTKESTPKRKLGQDLTFYSAEEVNIALNEGRLELNE
jgi:DNA-directed RNA polymerase subunit beta'